VRAAARSSCRARPIVYDAKGDAWVFAKTAPSSFERRRVEVERMTDDLAVLARGPEAGHRESRRRRSWSSTASSSGPAM
jgi:hypothetical protein